MAKFNKYSKFFGITARFGLDKEETILDFTEGRTAKLSDLTPAEYDDLMLKLESFNTIPPGDKQRKKMISIAITMNKASDAKGAVTWLDSWCKHQKFNKKLNDLTEYELNILLHILETKVLKDYLSKSI